MALFAVTRARYIAIFGYTYIYTYIRTYEHENKHIYTTTVVKIFSDIHHATLGYIRDIPLKIALGDNLLGVSRKKTSKKF